MAKYFSIRSARGVRAAYGLFQGRRTLWQMLREVFNGRYRMSGFTVLVCVLAIAYIVFPFDFMHDYVPFLGWIDDGFVFFLLVKRLRAESQRYTRFKAMERKVR